MSELNYILEELLGNIRRTHPEDFRRVFLELSSILNNIIQHPQERMYRYISLQAEKIRYILSLIPEIVNLLVTLGYTQINNNYIYNRNTLEPIKQCIYQLNSILSKYSPPTYQKNIPIINNQVQIPNKNDNHVIVYLYDLSVGVVPGFSTLLLGKQINGIWHTGINVFGYEYYYGGGIQRTQPKKTPYGLPVKELDFGYTTQTRESFENYLRSLNNVFKKENYNLIIHNCNHFTDTALFFLTGRHLPEQIVMQHKEIINSPTGKIILPLLQIAVNELNNVSNALLPILVEGNNNYNINGIRNNNIKISNISRTNYK